MLAKVGLDPNPDMKNKFAAFSSKLALVMQKRVGAYMKGVVSTLMVNLSHQHSKVRKSSLRGLRDVLCCKGAEVYMGEGPIVQLKFTMNDRSQDVRLEFYNVVFHWMKEMDIHYLKQFEADMAQFLLNGISDDKLDIGPTCIDFLEEHGKRMKEAMKALGEDEEELKEEAADQNDSKPFVSDRKEPVDVEMKTN